MVPMYCTETTNYCEDADEVKDGVSYVTDRCHTPTSDYESASIYVMKERPKNLPYYYFYD